MDTIELISLGFDSCLWVGVKKIMEDKQDFWDDAWFGGIKQVFRSCMIEACIEEGVI